MFDMKKFKSSLLDLVTESVGKDNVTEAKEVILGGFAQIEKELTLAIESAVAEQSKAKVEEVRLSMESKVQEGLKEAGDRMKVYAESAVQEFLKSNEERLVVESQNRVGARLFKGIGELVGESFIASADGSAQIATLTNEVGEWKEKANDSENRALAAESRLKTAEYNARVAKVGSSLPTAERLTFESRVEGKDYSEEDLVAIRDNAFLTSSVSTLTGESDESAADQIEAENADALTGESDESAEDNSETANEEVLSAESQESTEVTPDPKAEKHRKLMGW